MLRRLVLLAVLAAAAGGGAAADGGTGPAVTALTVGLPGGDTVQLAVPAGGDFLNAATAFSRQVCVCLSL